MSLHFQMVSFNWLDVALLVIFVVFFLRGLWVGFTRSISTLIGLLVGFWVAINYFPSLEAHLAVLVQNETWRPLMAFTLLFLAVYLFFVVLGFLLHYLLKALKISWMDRILGGGLGLIKGFIVAGGIIFILTLFLPTNNKILKNSAMYPTISNAAQMLTTLVPQHLKGKFMWKWRRIDNRKKSKRERI